MLGITQHLSRWRHQPIMWISVIGFLWLASSSQAAIIFQDNFEYVVDRNVTNGQIPFETRGWTDAKANNTDYNRGSGYLYTRHDTTINSRVLVLESLPTTSPCSPWCQTDYYLKYGSDVHPLGTVPANVWIQFWTYTVPGSRWDTRNKFLYPCHTFYPCPAESYLWILSTPREDLTGEGDNTVSAPEGGRFFRLVSAYTNYSGGAPWNAQKLYQNLSHTPLLEGVWYQVRVHIDTSGPQGVYELWVRQQGVSTWTKLAEWIGGVTPNFTWPIPEDMRTGNKVIAMPTTVDTYDSTTYLDDFIMATSAADLEGGIGGGVGGDTTPPIPPRNVQVAP